MCDHCGCGQTDDHHHHHESSGRIIEIQEDVLAHDKEHAERLRNKLAEQDARLVNVIGSPGCGKTALLVSLIGRLQAERRCVVIEGDLATTNDAERIRATGAAAYQVQTGTACHLSAHDVDHGLEHLRLEPGSLVLVENVGNLVCPSMFDVGETLRIVCLSVTEGTDKPQKYPVAFREAGLAVITKSDLLPHVDFDLEASLGMIRDIQPDAAHIVTSARDGSGLDELATHLLGLWA
jgi:hydrogenase nickel incorporation protein HypB